MQNMLRVLNSFLQSTRLSVASPTSWNANAISTSWISYLHPYDDKRPKQPLNAYMIFLQEKRPSMRKPGNPSETVKSIAARWNELPESEKQPYITKQKQLQEKYREERASYNALLSTEEKRKLLKTFRDNKDKRNKKIHKRQVKQSDPPKRNRSPYAIFMSTRFSGVEIRTWSEIMAIMKDARNTWITMTEAQKKRYVDQAAQDKDRYTKEMEEYVKRMKAEGKIDLLPIKYQRMIKSQERSRNKAKKG